MSENTSSPAEIANGLGILAAIICFFFGFDKGEWIGGLVASAVAYGGVHLAFMAIGLLWRWILISGVLLLVLASLKNRWDWLVDVVN